EEILMKGATHNLNVRTRTDVALYVLNHKRGHLRDLESSFKVSLAVVADPTVSGQQSFIIDRGEQVHTLEAAKALLAAQAAADPGQNGDRRPRRRGRRGGRRRRGGREDGLAGSISDELAPPPEHEATTAVADFDGGSEPAPSLVQQPEPVTQPYQPEVVEP